MIVFKAPDRYLDVLKQELEWKRLTIHKIEGQYFFLKEPTDQKIYWAEECFEQTQKFYFKSIKEAARAIRKTGFYNTHDGTINARRAELILKELPVFKKITYDPFSKIEYKKYNSFYLNDSQSGTLLINGCSELPGGQIKFNENKKDAPSRAYLKLWEAFSRFNVKPGKKDTVIDFGACPGGWSWVLSPLVKEVISIDKAPLDSRILRLKNVKQLKKDAFSIQPNELPRVDWFFSDIICEPKRLLTLIHQWQDAGVQNFICTLKFKGQTDFQIIEEFEKIEGGKLVHLFHNKHELTFLKLPPQGAV